MACDICGKTGTHLVDLLSIYKTEHIQQICPECEKVANKQVRKIQDMTHNLLRDLMHRFLRQRKQDFTIAER